MSLLLDPSASTTSASAMTFLSGLQPVASSTVGINNPYASESDSSSLNPTIPANASVPTSKSASASGSQSTASASEVTNAGASYGFSKTSVLVSLLVCVALTAPLSC